MLYFNDQTKVVFGSDQAQDLAVCRVITEDEVPDLIANGATVDASANYTSPNGSSAGTPADSMLNQDAPAAKDQDASAINSGTEGDVPSSQDRENEYAQALNTSYASLSSDTPLSGTAVEVKQVGDSTVNTGIQQNGNMLAGQVTGNQLVNSGVTVDAPAVVVENTERDLNPLVPAAGTEGPPASQLAAQAAEPEAEELPRESHLMLLESKFAAILAKLRNQERVTLDEVEAVYAHVKAVL